MNDDDDNRDDGAAFAFLIVLTALLIGVGAVWLAW